MSRLGLTLAEVQAMLGGGDLEGSGDFFCEGVASLSAAGPQDISFVKDGGYFDEARASGAGALLVPSPIDDCGAEQLVVPNPFHAFGMVLRVVAKEKRRSSGTVHAKAHIDESAELAEGVTIGAGAIVCEGTRIGSGTVIYGGAYIGCRTTIGNDCVIHPNVVVMEDVQIGDRVVVHGGSVIGADGYGYMQHEGRHIKVPQVGTVVIGDDVEIGALATIDRATMDATVIGRGTKIGDLCHVAHNCEVGEDVLLLPLVGLSGSVKVGRGAVFAGRSGCSDNLTIGEGAVLGGATVAYEDVSPGARVWGNPARDQADEMRVQAFLGRLPRLARDVRAIKKELDM
jgi:UDP-3-O-[3-hydroxymyristoyl] glucosamine N-acyltransferase